MRRYPLPLFAFALALALASEPAAAPAAPASDRPAPSAFAGEAPVTPADVPAALAALTELNSPNPDISRLLEIARLNGVTLRRLEFLTIKFVNGALLLKPGGVSRQEMLEHSSDPLTLPDDAELEVIRGALDEILAIGGR
ncbi:MAG: hypothetical protein LBQ79_10575 [Deltaproteobacteria bacterium]|jgi:hypothetical protein|nr:hypothetical protein [Deltaproteobacteria bacterium]